MCCMWQACPDSVDATNAGSWPGGAVGSAQAREIDGNLHAHYTDARLDNTTQQYHHSEFALPIVYCCPLGAPLCTHHHCLGGGVLLRITVWQQRHRDHW